MPIVTVFRSRLRPDAVSNGYPELAMVMEARARATPGFIDFKSFTSLDGERVSIITFDTKENQAGWRDDSEHKEAQRRGRDEFYSQYTIQVCDELDRREFSLPGEHPMAHHHSELTDPQLRRILDALPDGPFTPGQALAAVLGAGVVNTRADISSAIDDLEDAGLLRQVANNPPRWEK